MLEIFDRAIQQDNCKEALRVEGRSKITSIHRFRKSQGFKKISLELKKFNNVA